MFFEMRDFSLIWMGQERSHVQPLLPSPFDKLTRIVLTVPLVMPRCSRWTEVRMMPSLAASSE